jgi:tRNA pseudouridine55 synthase
MSTVSGFLLVNKPSGPTSHDIIDQLRRITRIKRIGHAGTLDPFATGLLIVGVGRAATRQLVKFLKMDKVYKAKLKLGATSDTYDLTGKIQEIRNKLQTITEQQIEKTLKQFVGIIEQVPPMYSAKKIKGVKLYELARRGNEVKREPTKIKIHDLRFMNYEWPYLQIECRVSSGTYIRSLAYDIGQKLGAGAYLEALERTQVGSYKLTEAVDLSKLNKNNWQVYLTQL